MGSYQLTFEWTGFTGWTGFLSAFLGTAGDRGSVPAPAGPHPPVGAASCREGHRRRAIPPVGAASCREGHRRRAIPPVGAASCREGHRRRAIPPVGAASCREGRWYRAGSRLEAAPTGGGDVVGLGGAVSGWIHRIRGPCPSHLCPRPYNACTVFEHGRLALG
jgi:hypothetical protein